jgi:DNA topoisomerase-1
LVARRLGNTRTVCRASYIHPSILDAYADNALVASDGYSRPRGRQGVSDERLNSKLTREESAVVSCIERRFANARTA